MLLLISYLLFSNTKNFNFTNTSTTIHMIDNNTIQISEHPFFPLGFYHDSYNLPFQKLIQAVRDISISGFNTIYASCNNLDNYGIFLDEAERLGIYVITQFNIEDPLAVVKKFKDKPAILGWSIADDAGDHASRDQILAFHKQIKAIDPKHYTYISISGWSRKWSEYTDVADLIGGQSYPIGYPFNNKPQGLPNDLITVYHVFNIGRFEANKHKRPVIANLQTFNWKNERWPTDDEVYNMTYQAILAGVKGILFYSYEIDEDKSITQQPYIWSRLKSIVPEINRLSPVFLEGTLTKLDTKFNDVVAGQWTYQSSSYIIVINTSLQDIRQVAIKIPTKTTSLVQPLFPNRPSGMVIKDSELRGFIKPGDVHIYQLSS
jgi:hypothetical protein